MVKKLKIKLTWLIHKVDRSQSIVHLSFATGLNPWQGKEINFNKLNLKK